MEDELPVDKAAFHAANMATNNSLDNLDSLNTLKTLQNTNACLTEVDHEIEAAKKYHLVLSASKKSKVTIDSLLFILYLTATLYISRYFKGGFVVVVVVVVVSAQFPTNNHIA